MKYCDKCIKVRESIRVTKIQIYDINRDIISYKSKIRINEDRAISKGKLLEKLLEKLK